MGSRPSIKKKGKKKKEEESTEIDFPCCHDKHFSFSLSL
jgi:hypothetical protein